MRKFYPVDTVEYLINNNKSKMIHANTKPVMSFVFRPRSRGFCHTFRLPSQGLWFKCLTTLQNSSLNDWVIEPIIQKNTFITLL